jgi:hypothetical protein
MMFKYVEEQDEYVCMDTRQAFSMLDVTDVLPDRRDDGADIATIKLLHEVEFIRRQLRALEPQLSKAITAFGWRRGQSGYREFYLRNALNRQQYKER